MCVALLLKKYPWTLKNATLNISGVEVIWLTQTVVQQYSKVPAHVPLYQSDQQSTKENVQIEPWQANYHYCQCELLTGAL